MYQEVYTQPSFSSGWLWFFGFVIVIAVTIFIIFLLYLPGYGFVDQNFSIIMNGAQIVPPVTTTGKGLGKFSLENDNTKIEYNIQASTLSSAVTSAFLAIGDVGVNGLKVKDLPFTNTATGTAQISGVWTTENSTQPLTSTIVDAFKQGKAYVVVATSTNTNGEIRGQIIPLLG